MVDLSSAPPSAPTGLAPTPTPNLPTATPFLADAVNLAVADLTVAFSSQATLIQRLRDRINALHVAQINERINGPVLRADQSSRQEAALSSTEPKAIAREAAALADPARLYPQAFDPAADLGAIREQIEQARDASIACLDAFRESDFAGVSQACSAIALHLAAAVKIKAPYPALKSILDFVRRSVMTVSVEAITLPQLNMLISTLSSLASQPIIQLNDAARYSEEMADQGWEGDEAQLDDLMDAVLATLSTASTLDPVGEEH